MIVLDTNVLLYLMDQRSGEHEQVRSWLQRKLDDGEVFGLPWICIVAFVRISTLPSMLARPLTVEQSLGFVEKLIARQDSFVVLESTSAQFLSFARLLRAAGMARNLTNDAHIAAVALANGGRVASYDRDFLRFEGIQLIVPE